MGSAQPSTSLRSGTDKAREHPPPSVRCSCELLVELCEREQVRALLGGFGIEGTAIAAARAKFHETTPPEPTTWRLRYDRRADQDANVPAHLGLLAIVRSADSHGYRLLEQLGVSCTKLRKHIVLPESEGSEGAYPIDVRPVVRERPPRERPPPEHGAASEPTGACNTSAPSEARCETAAVFRCLHAVDVRDLGALEGRASELSRLADALLRSSPKPLLLVGGPGSGRTSLALHLATALERSIHRLEAPSYQDEQQLERDLRDIERRGGIAVIDDLDRIPGDVPPPILGPLSQAWARGSPPLLTIVSHEGQARLETWMPGVLATFDVLALPPLTGACLHTAVQQSATAILDAHRLSLARDAKLSELTRLAEKYLGGLAMPGRALDLLDLACARTARQGGGELKRETWFEIVHERSGISRERLEAGDGRSMLELEHALARKVVGHRDVLTTLAQLVRRNRAGFSGNRPIASVLLLGPSGVGKTEIAKTLCEALFDKPDALLRLDMSEYAEPHTVARVVGAPPGYVGYEQGGALTDPLMQRPHCVVLLDEIEKAHRDVHQLLLQVFDEGRLTDGRGRTVDFRHAIIVMTSNLGAELAGRSRNPQDDDEILATARSAFPVELWNRIEAPIVMRPLSVSELRTVCQRLAQASSERLFVERGIRYTLSQPVCDYLVRLAGRDPALGARPLRHLLAREIESVLAEAILRGRLRAGTQALVELRDGRIAVT